MMWPKDEKSIQQQLVPNQMCIAFDVTSLSTFKDQQEKQFKSYGTIALNLEQLNNYNGSFTNQSVDFYAPFFLTLDKNGTIDTISYEVNVSKFQQDNTNALLYEINDLFKKFSNSVSIIRNNSYALGTFQTQYTPVKGGVRRIQTQVVDVAKKKELF